MAKYHIQNPSTCRETLASFKVCVDGLRFSTCVINLSFKKNICCGLKKVVAKIRTRVYFEQQILALQSVFHQTDVQLLTQRVARQVGSNTFADWKISCHDSLTHVIKLSSRFVANLDTAANLCASRPQANRCLTICSMFFFLVGRHYYNKTLHDGSTESSAYFFPRDPQ